MSTHSNESDDEAPSESGTVIIKHGALTRDMGVEFSEIIALGTDERKYPGEFSKGGLKRQWDTKGQIIRKMDLPAFTIETEEEFEEWAAKATEVAKRHQVCMEVFQEAWVICASEGYSLTVSRATAKNYEELFDLVAQEMFPHSDYLQKLENELWTGSRQASVVQAHVWLKEKACRYVRLCRRWDTVLTLSNPRMVQTCLKTLPEIVEDRVRMLMDLPAPLSDIWKMATRHEQDLKRLGQGKLPEPMGAFPVDVPMTDAQPKGKAAPRKPNRPCFGCEELDHFYKDCPHKQTRCAKCQMIGHLANACKNWVVVDSSGRVELRVRSRQKGTEVTQRKDVSQKDKATTGEAIFREFKEKILNRAEQSKKKPATEQKTNKRKKVDHPVGAADKAEGSGSEESSSEDWEREWLELGKLMRESYVVCKGNDTNRTKVTINNQVVEVLPDTGSDYSLCSKEMAEALGIELTTEVVRFKGLGRAEARKCAPVCVSLQGRSV
eukprot:Platyproteum_vivax@DN8634_c0_g1_i1.p1